MEIDRRTFMFGTLAAMTGLAATNQATASLGEAGRKGSFVFSTDDLSTEVARDPQKGVYIAPDSDTTGASGAWVRQYDGHLKLSWFGAAGGNTNDAAALQAALDFADGRIPILIDQIHLIESQINIPANGAQLFGENPDTTGFQLATSGTGGSHIAFYVLSATGKVFLRDFLLDGKNGGQLDSGLIQIAGSQEYADIDGLKIINAGDPADAGPAGVNGIAVAGSTYPGGNKAKARIRNCHIEATTKSAINVTTLAEEVLVESNFLANIIGNGYAAGIQVNGGRKVDVVNNRVYNTEGAGILVATVGTTPPMEPQQVWIDGNVIVDAGQNGTARNEPHGILISDSNNSGNSSNFTVNLGTNTCINSYDRGLYISTFNGQIIGEKLIVEKSTIGAYFQDCSNVRFSKLDFTDVNVRGLSDANVAAIWFNNADDVEIGHVKYRNKNDSTEPEHIIFATSTACNRITIGAMNFEGSVSGNIVNAAVGLFMDSDFTWRDKEVVAGGGSSIVLVYPVADNQTARLRTSAQGHCTSSQSNQYFDGFFRSASGTCTALNTAQPTNYKGTGIATGLFMDASGANLRQHFFAHSSEETTFIYETRLELS